MTHEYLTVQEAARILRVHKTTLYKQIQRGQYPIHKIGTAIRIPAHEIHAPKTQAPNPYRTTNNNVIPIFSKQNR